jgi:hypothetical protein
MAVDHDRGRATTPCGPCAPSRPYPTARPLLSRGTCGPCGACGAAVPSKPSGPHGACRPHGSRWSHQAPGPRQASERGPTPEISNHFDFKWPRLKPERWSTSGAIAPWGATAAPPETSPSFEHDARGRRCSLLHAAAPREGSSPAAASAPRLPQPAVPAARATAPCPGRKRCGIAAASARLALSYPLGGEAPPAPRADNAGRRRAMHFMHLSCVQIGMSTTIT